MKHTPALFFAALCALAVPAGAQSIPKASPAEIGRATAPVKATAARHVRPSRPTSPGLPLPPAPLVGGGDDCNVPDVIVGTGTFAFDNTSASTGVDGQADPLCNQAAAGMAILDDVWFTWNAPASGLARITTCGLTTVDTKIAVYTGTTCPVLNSAIACNDDACVGLQSTIEFACTIGNDYLLQLGNYPGQVPPAVPGSGLFSIDVLTAPSNDDCNAPQTVIGLTSVSFDNAQATTGAEGQAEAICNLFGGTAIRRDLWYAWTATFTGTAQVRTCGSVLDTKIAVYDGAGCPSAAAIACNDDACGLQSRALFACISGQTYTFQIGLYQGINTGGPGTFEVADAQPPVHDDCSGAQALSGSGPFSFDTLNATAGAQGQSEALCNQQGGTAINADLWFTWTAPATDTYSVQDLGLTEVDTKIAVYDGAGCPSAPAIACNDDANDPNAVYLQSQAIFIGLAGNSYTIQLGLSSTTSSGGVGEFSIRAVAASGNDDCSSAAPISGPGPHLFDNTHATTGAEGQTEAACFTFGVATVPQDVWYAWTATESGNATLTTCGLTAVDTKIAVYAGPGCPTASSLACNDDACGSVGYQSQLSFAATCGSVYTIQVGVYPLYGAPAGGEGRFTIDVQGGTTCAPGTVFCAGDGVAPHTACPCGNDSAPVDEVGCLNSLGTGGRLRASGVPSVSADSVLLLGSQMPSSSCLYFQGTGQVAGGNGAVLGDGLRCAGGTITRLGIGTNVAGASQYPTVGNAPVSVRGNLPAAGGTRAYQCWYRNAASFCTASTFNLTNGLEIVWVP